MNVPTLRAFTLAGQIVAGCLACVACSTPATTWHTLMRPAAHGSAALAASVFSANSANPVRPPPIDVLTVSVPAQVDVPQLIVSLPDGTMQRLEQQRWAAPLNTEFRDALSASLTRRLGVPDIHDTGRPVRPVWRVATTVRRFDAEAEGPSALQVSWTLRRLAAETPPREAVTREAVGQEAAPATGGAHAPSAAPPPVTISCESLLTFTSAAQPAAIVEGFRRAIDELADRMAGTLGQAESRLASVPAGPTSAPAGPPAAPCPSDRTEPGAPGGPEPHDASWMRP